MAERDRYRSDDRWNRDDDWRREGSSYRSNDENRRTSSDRDDYGRSREFGGGRGDHWQGDFGRSDYGRSDYGRDFGRGDIGRDHGRSRDFGSGYGDQSFGSDYGRDQGRSDWNRSEFDRPGARDQRGTYGGLGYGGSSSFGRYGEGSSGGYGAYGPGQYGRNYGSRSSPQSDWERGRGDFQRGRDHEDDRGLIERATDAVSSWFGGEPQYHRGRGPKGYTRSDDRIREDVSDRLGDDWMIDATEIEVMVVGGEVTLSGSVNSRDERRRAEDVAESVSGVKHVQNNVRVSGNTTAGFGNPGTTSSSAGSSTGSSSSSGSTTRKGGTGA